MVASTGLVPSLSSLGLVGLQTPNSQLWHHRIRRDCVHAVTPITGVSSRVLGARINLCHELRLTGFDLAVHTQAQATAIGSAIRVIIAHLLQDRIQPDCVSVVSTTQESCGPLVS